MMIVPSGPETDMDRSFSRVITGDMIRIMVIIPVRIMFPFLRRIISMIISLLSRIDNPVGDLLALRDRQWKCSLVSFSLREKRGLLLNQLSRRIGSHLPYQQTGFFGFSVLSIYPGPKEQEL